MSILEILLGDNQLTFWILAIATISFVPLYVLCLFVPRWRLENRRLCERYLSAAEIPNLNWVWGSNSRLAWSGNGGFKTDNLQLAISPQGLCLKQEDQGLIFFAPEFVWVYLPTVCIPWEFVKCVNHSKFGFFDAQITISGFVDGGTLDICVKSTDVRMGKLVAECAAAACSI